MPEHFREGTVIAEYEDKYGDKQTIHKGKNGLQVKRPVLTPVLELTTVIGKHIGRRVRELRTERGWTMEELGVRCAFPGTPKQRIWEIEEGTRGGGIRLGTLYVVARALGVHHCDLLPTDNDAFGELGSK